MKPETNHFEGAFRLYTPFLNGGISWLLQSSEMEMKEAHLETGGRGKRRVERWILQKDVHNISIASAKVSIQWKGKRRSMDNEI